MIVQINKCCDFFLLFAQQGIISIITYSSPPAPIPYPLARNSLRVTPERKGSSHRTEAWQLPAPARPPEADGDESHQSDQAGGGGGYVGIFRPPGGADADMGFHMCVAVLPSGGSGGSGVVAEKLDAPSTNRNRGPPHDVEVCGKRRGKRRMECFGKRALVWFFLADIIVLARA